MSFILAANWKMNLGREASRDLARELVAKHSSLKKSEIWITPSFTAISDVKAVAGSLKVGAQNAHWAESGAFTGEISCSMLKDLGIEYVVVGHSERRHVFFESDEMVLKRADAVINSGLFLVYCIGETIQEREKGETEKVISRQLSGILNNPKVTKSNTLIAYEPVWAIGTGKTATLDEIKSTHSYIKNLWKGKDSPLILYGGSVNPDNIVDISKVQNVSGALIGGASNTYSSFSSMINAIESN